MVTTHQGEQHKTCVQAATEILGDKWTPRLIGFLAEQPLAGFCQIQAALDDINPRTLSARLAKLEKLEVVRKECPSSGKRSYYSLTPKGQDLAPILQTMSAWSQKYGLCLIERRRS